MVGLGRREPKTWLVTFRPEAAALALWACGVPQAGGSSGSPKAKGLGET